MLQSYWLNTYIVYFIILTVYTKHFSLDGY